MAPPSFSMSLVILFSGSVMLKNRLPPPGERLLGGDVLLLLLGASVAAGGGVDASAARLLVNGLRINERSAAAGAPAPSAPWAASLGGIASSAVGIALASCPAARGLPVETGAGTCAKATVGADLAGGDLCVGAPAALTCSAEAACGAAASSLVEEDPRREDSHAIG